MLAAAMAPSPKCSLPEAPLRLSRRSIRPTPNSRMRGHALEPSWRNFNGATHSSCRLVNSTYDIAVMALVISFVPDPLKAVTEMARVVRPGGWIATYMWDRPGGGTPLEPINVAARSLGMDPPPPPGVEISRAHAMRDLWQKAGLTSIETRVIRVPVVYADFDDFWEFQHRARGTAGEIPPRDVTGRKRATASASARTIACLRRRANCLRSIRKCSEGPTVSCPRYGKVHAGGTCQDCTAAAISAPALGASGEPSSGR